MNIGNAFPSKYLKAADLQGRRVVVTIDRVEMENFDDGDKAIVYFVGKDKGVVLNRTNANTLVDITGSEETGEWKGVSITLYEAKVEYKGKRVPSIRIDEAPANTAPKAAAAAPAPSPAPEQEFNDDDIPF